MSMRLELRTELQMTPRDEGRIAGGILVNLAKHDKLPDETELFRIQGVRVFVSEALREITGKNSNLTSFSDTETPIDPTIARATLKKIVTKSGHSVLVFLPSDRPIPAKAQGFQVVKSGNPFSFSFILKRAPTHPI